MRVAFSDVCVSGPSVVVAMHSESGQVKVKRACVDAREIMISASDMRGNCSHQSMPRKASKYKENPKKRGGWIEKPAKPGKTCKTWKNLGNPKNSQNIKS